jgi:hypothetical protein
MGAVYTDRIPESKRIGGELQIGLNSGVITDALVAANSTIATLQAALLTPSPNQANIKKQVNDALQRGLNMALFSSTHGVTTVAALVALTDAPVNYRQGFLG